MVHNFKRHADPIGSTLPHRNENLHRKASHQLFSTYSSHQQHNQMVHNFKRHADPIGSTLRFDTETTVTRPSRNPPTPSSHLRVTNGRPHAPTPIPECRHPNYRDDAPKTSLPAAAAVRTTGVDTQPFRQPMRTGNPDPQKKIRNHSVARLSIFARFPPLAARRKRPETTSTAITARTDGVDTNPFGTTMGTGKPNPHKKIRRHSPTRPADFDRF